ncbi:hypothetical protein GS597_19520 [Synechococcales cyanobacterium C]|uniref:Co-chaperone DjlA N-terminal domain-containing protein n=1 Tax=Petrachloros mirabilis ULC683 TaxID=2781853 RepID=A0A8K2A2E8_9CYAN|nr:hypothetical protein [Petrachloros mirabilis]NCJ08656.1 hypothetical protein [Petrachloros mirabilis ULC683]
MSPDPEAIRANIKILLSVALADGKFEQSERREIEAVLAKVQLPEPLDLDQLSAEPLDYAQEAAKLTSPEVQTALLDSLVNVIWANGEFDAGEEAALRQILAALEYPPERIEGAVTSVRRNLALLNLVKVAPIEDPEKRQQAIHNSTRNHAIVSAVLGAFPVPILSIGTDFLVLAVQISLLLDITGYWGYGQSFDRKSILELLVGSSGLGVTAFLTRNLAKLVPGFGSVVGASTAFATTWAIGKVTDTYYAQGRQVAPEALRHLFKQAKQEGEAAYEANEAVITQARQKNQGAIRSLTEDLQAGKISQVEYQQRLQELL